jgi:hypothetical protein
MGCFFLLLQKSTIEPGYMLGGKDERRIRQGSAWVGKGENLGKVQRGGTVPGSWRCRGAEATFLVSGFKWPKALWRLRRSFQVSSSWFLVEFKGRFQAYIQKNKNENKIPGWERKEVLIPVVFYVYYPKNNIAADHLIKDSVIINQLAVINERFQGREFKLMGKSVKFKFCLATRYVDTVGVFRPLTHALKLPTNRLKPSSTTPGIIYIGDSTTGYGYYNNVNPSLTAGRRVRLLNQISGLDANRFLRFHISNNAGGLLGGAFPPIASVLREIYLDIIYSPDSLPFKTGYFQQFDGVNVTKPLIGSPSYTPYGVNFYKQGKKVIHEIGHAFGLNHSSLPDEYTDAIFAPFDCKDSLKYLSDNPLSDFISDTPPPRTHTSETDIFKNNVNSYNSCTQERINLIAQQSKCPNSSKLPVMNNPMDYVSDHCQDTFTTGQVERMVFTASYYRSQMISPENAFVTGVNCGPGAGFWLSQSSFCSEADSVDFAMKFQNGGSTSDSIKVGLNANQYRVVDKTSNSALIRLYPKANLPFQFTVSYKIVTSGTPSETLISSQTLFFSPRPCYAKDKTKKHLFFGQQAGLTTSNQGKVVGNEDSYDSRPLSQRIEVFSGTVTYNDPETGNLVYYAAGQHLWNKNHKRLTGISNQLQTNDSSTQFGISVSHPTKPNHSILFTVPADTFVQKGFRLHVIHHANINASNPSLTGSILNQPLTLPSKYPIKRASDGAIHVADKITVIRKKCLENAFWILVQGHRLDPNYKNKILVFSLSSTDTLPRLVDSCYAGGWARQGVMKASPDGSKVVNTFTNANYPAGTGKGFVPKIYNFNPENGQISLLGKVTTNHFADSVSAFGASFTKQAAYVYLAVNNPGLETGLVPLRGLYRFAVGSQSGPNFSGQKVAEVHKGQANVQLCLDAYHKILASRYFEPHLDIFHSPEAAEPNYQKAGVSLTQNPVKFLRAASGLPNFIDSEPFDLNTAGQTQNNPKLLGTNPGSCCPHVDVSNVACTGNDNNSLGNDIFYEFSLARNCTQYDNGSPPACQQFEFLRPLRVDVSDSEFGVTAKLEYLNTEANPPDWAIPPIITSSGILKVPIDTLNELNASDTTIKFRLSVDANSAQTSGNFVVKVNYRHFDGTSNGPSCCRIALEEGHVQPEESIAEKQTLLRVVPNPAQNQITIQTNCEWAEYRIVNVQGRTVHSGSGFNGEIILPTVKLPNGLFRIILFGQQGTKSINFQIIK